MRTALRKMGNSTGMIVPKAILNALGAKPGAAFEMSVEKGRIVASPVETGVRAQWAEAAARIAEEEDAAAREWQDFANDEDEDLIW